MNKVVSTLAFCLFLGIAQASYAATVHPLGDQSPSAAGFSTNNIFFEDARGWAFTAGAANIDVTQLGIDPVTSGSYTIALMDFASQSVLAQTTINNVVGGVWNWADLSSGVSLQSGDEYLVMGIGNDPNATYYFANGLPSSWYPTGDINYVEMRYCNGCTVNDFPTGVLPGYQYGVVDIGYTTTTGVPEPETYAMLLSGLGLLGFAALRGKSKVAQALQP